MMATRSDYTRQIERLDAHVAVLGRSVVDGVLDTGRGLEQGDEAALADVLGGHAESKRLHRSVEDSCMSLMLLQRPLGSDLRLVTAAFRAISDLARIDEMSYQIALLCQEEHLAGAGGLGETFGTLARRVATMVRAAMDAFLESDVADAEAVFGMDDAVDELFESVRGRLVEELRAGGAVTDVAPELLICAKYYERMGDHAQSIADWAVFRATGAYRGVPMGE